MVGHSVSRHMVKNLVGQTLKLIRILDLNGVTRRRAWMDAKRVVLLDFGDAYLFRGFPHVGQCKIWRWKIYFQRTFCRKNPVETSTCWNNAHLNLCKHGFYSGYKWVRIGAGHITLTWITESLKKGIGGQTLMIPKATLLLVFLILVRLFFNFR